MGIAKSELLSIINCLPEEIDLDELMYRLYLKKKIDYAEEDIKEGRLMSHAEVVKETEKWFEE